MTYIMALNACNEIVNQIKQTSNEEIEIDTIRVEQTDSGNFTATAQVINPTDVDIDDFDINTITDLEQFISVSNESEEVQVQITDMEVTESLHERITTFKQAYVTDDTVTLRNPFFFYTRGEWVVQQPITVGPTDSRLEQLLDVAEGVVESSKRIADTTALEHVTCYINESDSHMPYDIEVLFTTDEPHKVWMSMDTLEEWCEFKAERNDDITVEKLLDQNEYMTHVHLMTETLDELMSVLTERMLTESVVTNKTVTVVKNRFETNFIDSCELECSIRQKV